MRIKKVYNFNHESLLAKKQDSKLKATVSYIEIIYNTDKRNKTCKFHSSCTTIN